MLQYTASLFKIIVVGSFLLMTPVLAQQKFSTRQIQKLKKELYDIIATHSKQSYDKVWTDSDRDYWMTSSEAKDYGMVDEILLRNPK